jgi:hypothetical protein
MAEFTGERHQQMQQLACTHDLHITAIPAATRVRHDTRTQMDHCISPPVHTLDHDSLSHWPLMTTTQQSEQE